MATHLDDAVQYLKGVGPHRAEDFSRLGVRTVRDLLFTFPRDLSDRRNATAIVDAEPGAELCIAARVTDVKEKRPRRGRIRSVVTAALEDETGTMTAVWFNSPWVADKLASGEVILFGKTRLEGGELRMDHPQIEPQHGRAAPGTPVAAASGLNVGRIVPVYPGTGRLTQPIWRRVMQTALDTALQEVEELYPDRFRTERSLVDRRTAIRDMHFPPDEDARARAHARLLYDECLFMQTAILLTRHHARADHPGRTFRVSPELDGRIRRLFPFRMTAAQDRAVGEIVRDMEASLPMHRLLQGDVGSGKTAVALYAMLAAVACGAQVVLMAPTGLLARQHHETLAAFLARSEETRVRTGLLLGGMPARQRQKLQAELAGGACDICIATHAAVTADTTFRDLGLVVIDEQHKFGVHQRAALVSKGIRPDTLVMTATPIPRSLALTVYGDLDVSVIDELPPGRKEVTTRVIPMRDADEAWTFLRREVSRGRQAFIVSPLLAESEALEVTSATEAFEQLSEGPLRGLRLALMHGAMSREEQRVVMDAFRGGEVDVLVSTVVIEVGVDVPNATAMVLLHAERFGLAQMHQLRGRIGRGGEAGHVLLLHEARTPVAEERLAILAATTDGFKIAEEDLRLRGPGEFLGTRQHGLPELKLVDIVRDIATIRQARDDAGRLLRADPALSQPSHQPLRRELQRMLGDRWTEVGVG